jgi:hypothetical protein
LLAYLDEQDLKPIAFAPMWGAFVWMVDAEMK